MTNLKNVTFSNKDEIIIIPNNKFYENRQNLVNYLINIFIKFISLLNINEKYAPKILYFFHIIFWSFLNIYLLLFPVDIIWKLLFFMFIFAIFMHIYFKACILVLMERQLYEDKNINGFWDDLFKLIGVPIDGKKIFWVITISLLFLYFNKYRLYYIKN